MRSSQNEQVWSASVERTHPCPFDILHTVLGEAPLPDPLPCRVTLRDGSLLAPFRAPLTPSLHEYRIAIDRRSMRSEWLVRGASGTFATATISGRQVGSIGSLIPTGRQFSALANMVFVGAPDPCQEMVIELALLNSLACSGIEIPLLCASPPLLDFRGLFEGSSVDRSDLLAGDVTETYWARAWRLPPRLARLAVLLMAGCSQTEIGKRMRLSERSVRTYTERLFALAKVHCRAELPVAALRDGKSPPAV